MTENTEIENKTAPSPAKKKGMSFALSAIIVGIGLIITKGSGLIRDVIVSLRFSEGIYRDAYTLAFNIPDLFYNLLVGGAIYSTIAPYMSAQLAVGKEEDGIKTVSKFITVVCIVMVVCCTIGTLFSEPLYVIYGLFNDVKNPDTIPLAAQASKLLFPQIFFIMLAALCNGILIAYRKFTITSFAPVFYNILVIVAIFVCGGNSLNRLMMTTGGILAASVFYFLFQYTLGFKQMKKFRRNAIYLCDKDTPEGGIPVGASKVGGMPDLPPDIEYPTMTGFTFRRKGQKPEEARVYPKTAMHLVMQINLYELAESGADKEDIFPKTGMLYLFWSGEMDDTVFDPENKYSFVRTDEPELSRVSKLIWWDGDISVLRRTEPTLPYYEDADDEDNGKFDDICPEKMISFADMTEYSREELMSIKGFSEIDARNDLELSDHGNKLLGVPWGCNIPYIEEDEIQLLQLRYSVGCVWSLFWIMKKQDFIDRDFTNIHLDADCD